MGLCGLASSLSISLPAPLAWPPPRARWADCGPDGRPWEEGEGGERQKRRDSGGKEREGGISHIGKFLSLKSTFWSSCSPFSAGNTKRSKYAECVERGGGRDRVGGRRAHFAGLKALPLCKVSRRLSNRPSWSSPPLLRSSTFVLVAIGLCFNLACFALSCVGTKHKCS